MAEFAEVRVWLSGWMVSAGGKVLGLARNLDEAKALARQHGLRVRILRDVERVSKNPCRRCGRADGYRLRLCSTCFAEATKAEFDEEIVRAHGCVVNGCQRLGYGILQMCADHKFSAYSWARRAGMTVTQFASWVDTYDARHRRRNCQHRSEV